MRVTKNVLGPVLSAMALLGGVSVTQAAAPLTVVTATTDLRSLAEAVGGDRVHVVSICYGNQDPHFVQAKPSYMMVAKKADLFVKVGMELEIGWESLIIDGSRNGKIRPGTRGYLDASDGVIRLEVPTAKVTRELGDVHPMGNPHYWLDPYNGRIVAREIADRLAELAPADAPVFKANLAAFQKSLDERMFGVTLVQQFGGEKLWELQLHNGLDDFLAAQKSTDRLGGWLGALRPFKGRAIVTYHRSWVYFAQRFGLVVAAELEPKPGIPPTASHLSDVIARVKADKIPLILVEPFYDRKSADFVAGKTGAKVAVLANAVDGQPEAKDYLALIDLIVKRVKDGLEGK